MVSGSASGLIARLAAEGISPDLLGEVATALVQAEAAQAAATAAQDALDKRRASDRERQAKRRETHVTSRDVTGHPQMSRDPAPKDNNQTPTQSPPSDPSGSEAPKGARRPKSILCPDDFEPSESHFAKAAANGRDRAFVFATRDRMRNWSHANAGRPVARKSDWSLAFHGFLEKAMAETSCHQPRGSPSGGQRLSGPTAAALARRQEPVSNVPTLDLEPVVRPFPDRRRTEAADLAEGGGEPPEGGVCRPFVREPWPVRDPVQRRAH